MMIRIIIFTIIFTLLFSIVIAADPCRFEYPGRGVIDLTTVGRTDGTAAFENATTTPGSGYRYSYNPCKPFTGGTFCENVAACQTAIDETQQFSIGTQDTASWNPGPETGGIPAISYVAGERRSLVLLQCSPSGEEKFEALGEDPINTYVFRLIHPCACWDGCSGTPTTTAPPIIDPCRFEYPGKGVIDLTSLGHTDGTPAYADRSLSSNMNYKYSYNPCKPFSEGPDCQNASVCQFEVEGPDTYILGVQESVFWSPGSGEGAMPSVTYTYGTRTVVIGLQCSTTGVDEFEVIGEDPMLVYIFRLTNKCACWDGCSGTSTTTLAPTTLPPPVTGPCRFEYPGKGVIDFSFIGRTDERAAYTNEVTRTVSNFKYSYNPCRSFSQGTNCIGVSVCQISKDGQETVPLGTQESASWNPGSDELNEVPSINYVYGNKKVSVLLQCSIEGNNEFQAFGEDPANTFKFHLTHKCACWNGCSNTTRIRTTAIDQLVQAL